MFNILVQERSTKLYRQQKHAPAPILSFRVAAITSTFGSSRGHIFPSSVVCGSSFLSPASESEVFLLLEEQREADDGRVYQQTAKDGHGRCAACDFRRVP
jgi:hypothetical protein